MNAEALLVSYERQNLLACAAQVAQQKNNIIAMRVLIGPPYQSRRTKQQLMYMKLK